MTWYVAVCRNTVGQLRDDAPQAASIANIHRHTIVVR